MGEVINSPSNPVIKKVRKVLRGDKRGFADLCAAEGIKVVEEAQRAAAQFDTLLITERLDTHAQGQSLRRLLAAGACPAITISHGLMASFSRIGAHQGVLALVRRPNWTVADLLQSAPPWLVVLEEIQDPGNLGAILRTCEAAGVSGVIVGAGTVDPFNAKSVRSSMGSVFRLPMVAAWKAEQTTEFLNAQGIRAIATGGRRGRPFTEVDFTGSSALIFGGEGRGLENSDFQSVNEWVHIPMSERVDSLNVAISASVILYEAWRQRRPTNSVD